MLMEPVEIDLVKYGVLWERVQQMDKKIDKMENQIEQLLELANKSKGGFWMGMTIASMVGGVVAWIIGHMKG
jgi:predicted PurR-regulated permease PerM